MTEERQRIAIAEFTGLWKDCRVKAGIHGDWDDVVGIARIDDDEWSDSEDYVPDYPCDLNAMHEAKKLLTEDQIPVYWQTLYEVCNTTQWPFNPEAYQEAETLLRTIGKWESP